MLTLHSREHRFLFSYLLLATGLLAGLAGWILYRNYDLQSENVGYLFEKLKRQEQIFKEQRAELPKLDSAYRDILAYRPEVTAMFLEADIDNQLLDIRRLYVRRMYTTNTADDTTRFFRAFDQVANFYQMLYWDKKILVTKQTNVKELSDQLATCKIDYNNRKAPLGTTGLVIPPALAPAPTPPAALPSPSLPR